MGGAVSSTDGDRDRGNDSVEGWYERCGEVGLANLVGKLFFLKVTLTVGRRFGVFSSLPTFPAEDQCEDVESSSSWSERPWPSVPTLE